VTADPADPSPPGECCDSPFLPVSAGLIPGPAFPVPWRALLGDVLLDADSWADLAAMTRVRRWKHGDTPVRAGESAVAMLALCEGRVAVGKGALSGPLWLDLHTAWLGGRYEQDLVVSSPSALVMEWPMAVAAAWLRGHPPLLEALIRAVAAQLRGKHSAINDLTTRDATGRVAAWLLAQAGAAPEIRLAERKRDVAAQLSISPETLSRTLRQLADRGILAVQGYRIGLLDRVELLALARYRTPV
jgi:CRP-like cAMP-binding protein